MSAPPIELSIAQARRMARGRPGLRRPAPDRPGRPPPPAQGVRPRRRHPGRLRERARAQPGAAAVRPPRSAPPHAAPRRRSRRASCSSTGPTWRRSCRAHTTGCSAGGWRTPTTGRPWTGSARIVRRSSTTSSSASAGIRRMHCVPTPTSRCWCRRTTNARISNRCCTTPALQHLLDGVFVLLCEGRCRDRYAQLQANLERIQPMLEP